MSSHLLKLYSELDFLYRNISSVCSECKDHDCEGYVWLLKDEASLLYNLNVPIVEINDSTFFIHSFEEANGSLSINKPKPPCKLRRDGLCSIYDSRPLVCRMYPVGLVTVDGKVLLVLHRDCKFSRDIKGEAKAVFIAQAVEILKQSSPGLLTKVLASYRKVDAISAFPEGPNTFEVIMPLRLLIDERR
jgi:Fe-S-cluster containining protein